MSSFRKKILILFLLISSINGYSGTIKGLVVEKRNGNPLPGVIVMLEGTSFGTTSGLDGSYVLHNIPSGDYYFRIRYSSFKTFASHISIKDDQVITVNAELEDTTSVLGDVVIKAKLKNGSDEQARNLEKNSDNVMNIMSARTIELLPDITVANVLQRVSGVQVQRDANGEARYASIRGMDKRYNYTLVNGIKIPSPDDKGRYVPLDIFPAEIVDRVEVIKTLTPGMEGDAIGGVTNMVMKNAPDHTVLYVSAATGYNQTLFDRSYESFPKSGVNLKDPIEKNGATYIAKVSDFQNRTGDIRDIQAPANGLFSLTAGDRFLKNKKLGVIFSASHQNTFKGSNTVFFLPSIQPGVENAPAITDLLVRNYSTQESRTGLHTKLDYEFNNRNSLSLYGMYLRLNELQTRDVVDTTVQINRTGAGNGPVDYTKRAALREQAIGNITLQGKHLLTDNLKMDYSLVYSQAKRDVPDMTELHTTANAKLDSNGHSYTTPMLFKSFKHSWERTKDEDLAGYLNLTYTPHIFGKDVEFMGGGMYRNKHRSNYYNDYTLQPATNTQPFSTIYAANMSVLQPSGDVNNDLNYKVTEDITAGYGQAKIDFSKLQILGGVRVENTHQKYSMNVDPNLVAGQSGEFKYTDVLPSVNLKYALNRKENIRLSYYESISRPGFFEIVPYRFSGENYDEVGNDSLNHTVAQNFDLRYEWFPKGIDQVLVGAFYKSITNPIEYLLAPQGGKASAGELKPMDIASDKPAVNTGIELLVTKYFHFFGVSANYTYTHSEITTTKLSRLRDSTGQIKNFTVSDTRPLQGQSQHIANLAVIYKNPKIGFDAHLSLVYTGRQIAFLSNYVGLDYWRKATSFFDFSCEKKIRKNISVYAKVNNLLNTPVIIELMKSKDQFITGTYQLPYQTLPNSTLVERDYYGRNYLVGIRFKLD